MDNIPPNVQPKGLEEDLPNTVETSIKNQRTEFRKVKKLKQPTRHKKKLEPTEAYQIFEKTLRVPAVFGRIIGADLNYEWKCGVLFIIANLVTYCFWLVNISNQVLNIYRDNIIQTLEQFAMYGIGISALLKLDCFRRSFKNITALFHSTFKLCQENDGTRAVRLKNRLLTNFTYFKSIACMAIIIIVLYTFYPVKSYLIDKELVPLLPLDFIILDHSTLFGFHLANLFMAIMGIYGIVITEYLGLIFVILIKNYALRVDIVEVDFNELDELWRNKSTSTLAFRRIFLRNICHKFVDMKKYIDEIKKIFDEKMFLYFVFAYFSQILCLYQIRVNNWIPGYSLAIGFFIEMIFYCIMGTQISLDNERLCYIITQSTWYKYDQQSQKTILTMLNVAMNSKELRIGSVMPLSVSTATEIVKSIYTYYTVMTEVL